MAEDSNKSRKNYSRYAMTSRDVLYNVLTAKRAKTKQMSIMWTDDDEEAILYPHEDAR